MFAGKSVYPEYINDLDNAVTNLAVAGDFTGAFQVGQINQKLYPASSKTNATMGILYTLAGEKTMALAALKKSLEINPQGDASATGLNTMAYNLQNIGQTKAGLNLLLTAIELHPKDANLYDSAGEFYLKLKDNQKGIEYYKKALEINPDYPNAKIAKEIIAKMNK
jgi:tetratricopeptide (TPR) repeat protein